MAKQAGGRARLRVWPWPAQGRVGTWLPEHKACLPGGEDASHRPARPCGIHPGNHNGQLVSRPSSWGHRRPGAVDQASRGEGTGRAEPLCPWQGQRLVRACGSASAEIVRQSGGLKLSTSSFWKLGMCYLPRQRGLQVANSLTRRWEGVLDPPGRSRAARVP